MFQTFRLDTIRLLSLPLINLSGDTLGQAKRIFDFCFLFLSFDLTLQTTYKDLKDTTFPYIKSSWQDLPFRHMQVQALL